ncbi:hypothetical protein CkaCkLH20_08050 [Colletotrichum karsti]|uniref:Methylated-DNA--protein-cysteine methyltransferase n=1 Tax=Colletotrichum karsti TaxID=1095194 RepID=A0A9P6LJE0_9PEZI|nr:uncharacterized protein CkaCkLH20_08050 [Colletotrichum karsti]KAF9874487.1 hypothetical protein CkaCkLH20_08050 [Colletotrichum karsti]
MARPSAAKPSPVARAITSVKIPEAEDMSTQLERIASSNRTQFEKRVWTALCQVPKGHVTTYAILAAHLKSSPRAVGNALRRNPFAPQVPCHRVVATGGALGGFKGKWPRNGEGITLDEKRLLLRKEGIKIDSGGRVLGSPRDVASGPFKRTPVTEEVTLPDGRTQNITFYADFTTSHNTVSPALVKRGWVSDTKDWDACGGSTFTSAWSSSAPLVEDCNFLQTYFQNTKGYFRVATSDLDANGVSWSRLVSVNTCGLSVRATPRPATAGYIGNTDFRDLIRDSISKFSQDGRVSVGGNTVCLDADGVHLTFTALAASLAAAAPTPQEDPAAVFGISFTYENGTFTDVFDVPETLSGYAIASNGIVTNVFIYPPGNKPVRCAFLEPEPSRKGLGAVSIVHATTIELSPAGEVGFVQCNRT